MPRKKSHKNILILGATSDMALAFINLFIDNWQKCTFHLLARNTETLHELKSRAETLGHHVFLYTYDLLNPPELNFTGIEYYIVYAGWLPPDNTEPEKTMLVNNTAIQHFTNKVIAANRNHLDHMIITGSVAGVRVRPSNRAYGQAKARLHEYVKALQKKFYPTFTCTLVIPGYVETKMIAGHKTPGFLTASPGDMAIKYWTWLETKPKIAWSQPVWRLIAFILKMIPEFIVKRLK
jgi:decaprenylphospho-beta-D-erythro-pentofuranosid-2-ulose 2-reductase